MILVDQGLLDLDLPVNILNNSASLHLFFENCHISSLILKVFECDGVLGDIAHKGRSCQPAHLVRRLTLVSIFNKLSPIFQYDLEHGPSTEKDHNSAIAAPHCWMGTGTRCNVWRNARFSSTSPQITAQSLNERTVLIAVN